MSEEKRKQKILIVHNYYQIPGGEDTVVANEKKLLQENGHEVVLYTRTNNELKDISIIRMLCLPFTTIFNLRTYREIKKIINQEKIDIVHVHNTLNLISPAVYYAAVKMKIPVIQTIHNFRLLCPGATFYRSGHICEDCVSKGLMCSVVHKCYRGSRAQTLVCALATWIHRHTGILRKIHYITLTEFNKEKLLQLKQIKPENVFVKPNFTFENSHVISEKKSKGSYYLYIGRIEEIKGIRILIDAFINMPDKELRLAGQGPLLKEFDGKANNIHFCGQVQHDELMKMIKNSKAVILPSQVYEGFPMTIAEAFSLHTPMIVGNIGNAGNLIVDGINGMKFKYNDSNDLIRVINTFEHENIDELGAQAYKFYNSLYSADANYLILKSIYDRIAKTDAD